MRRPKHKRAIPAKDRGSQRYRERDQPMPLPALPVAKTEHSKPTEKEDRENAKERRSEKRENAALAAAVIGVLLVIWSNLMTLAALNDARTARSEDSASADIRERPWMATTTPTIGQGDGGNILVGVSFKNFGITPARDFTGWIDGSLMEMTPTELPSPKHSNETKGVTIVPTGELFVNELVNAKLEAFKTKGGQRLYIYGKFRYVRDAPLGQEIPNGEFCFFVSSPLDIIARARDKQQIVFEFCEGHHNWSR